MRRARQCTRHAPRERRMREIDKLVKLALCGEVHDARSVLSFAFTPTASVTCTQSTTQSLTNSLCVAQVVRGCREVLGPVAHHRRALISNFHQLCHTYGFEYAEMPALQHASTLSHLGATSDVVSSQLFHIITSDRNADHVVLRPEGTAPMLRALSAVHGKHIGGFGRRVWYYGSMFRHERPQRLRQREFTQLGVEIVSDNTLTADVDVISVAHNFLTQCEWLYKKRSLQPKLILNTLGSAEDRRKYNTALLSYLQGHRLGALSEISQKRVLAGRCLRILDSKLAEDKDVMKDAPDLREFISPKEKVRFQHLQERLDEEQIKNVVDPTLVRGLDYYSSTAFEIEYDNRAIAAGGRYSNIHGLSGVGFALGLERVEDPAVSEKECNSWSGLQDGVCVLVAGLTKECYLAHNEFGMLARSITKQLRAAGINAMVRDEGGKLQRLVAKAVKAGVCAIVILGDMEFRQGKVKVRHVVGTLEEQENDNMQNQKLLPLDQAIEYCIKVVADERKNRNNGKNVVASETEAQQTHMATAR